MNSDSRCWSYDISQSVVHAFQNLYRATNFVGFDGHMHFSVAAIAVVVNL